MEEQLDFAKILYDSSYGIALRKPAQEIDVGDICYWTPDGRASRILNVFDNKQWLVQNEWPELKLTKEQAIDVTNDLNLGIIHGGGCFWGIQAFQGGFDVWFQKLQAGTISVIAPTSPTSIHGLRSGAKHILDQWWSLAKRYVFRSWTYLLNNQNEVFLVTKAVKTQRYGFCHSKANRGSATHIRIYGGTVHASGDVNLKLDGTSWAAVKNELDFQVQEGTANSAPWTIFIERDATRMFSLSEVTLKESAQRLWTACCGPPLQNGPPPNTWIATSHPQLVRPATAPPPPPPPPQNPPATFDGKDKLTLKDGWFLIRGSDGSFFLEHATSGLDLRYHKLTTDIFFKLMKVPRPHGTPPLPQPGVNPPPPPQPINGPPPNGHPPLPLNPAAFHINPPAVPGQGAMLPGFGPPQSINGQPQRPITMPNPMVPPMWGPPQSGFGGGFQGGGAPGIGPPGGGFPPFPGGGPMFQQPQHPQQPQQPATFPLGQIPGVAHISGPLNGIPGVQGFPAQIVGATPLPPPKMPENREISGPAIGGGLDGIIPNYTGFQFSGGQNGGPPIVNVQPAGIGGAGLDVPWQWRP